MALQVWLPLNGDLHNQGLSDVTVTNNGATVSNAGKIGSCYKFTTSQYMELNNLPFSSLTNCSISFWLYVTAKGSSGWLLFSGSSTSNQYYILATSGGTGSFYHKNAGSDIKIYKNGSLSTTPGSVGVWCHYVVTGVDLSTWTNFYINKYKDSVWNFTGQVNDIRIYDHCLSKKEVKDIAKGLVLHYPLDGEQAVNLNPFSLTDTNYNKGDYASKTVGTISNNIYHVSGYQSSSSADTSFWIETKSYITLQADTDYYLSFWCKSKSDGNLYFGTSSGSHTTLIDSSNTKHYPTNSFSLGTSFDGWVSLKIHTGSDTQYKIHIGFDVPNIYGVGSYIEFSNIMLSLTQPAYYIPYNNPSTIIDCSGYNNDGTIIGELSLSDDSPRYQRSTVFTKGNNHIVSPEINKSGWQNSYSVCWWSKTNNMNNNMAWGSKYGGGGNYLNLYPSGGVFCWNTGDGTSNPVQNNGASLSFTPYNDNKWHHYVMTGDGVDGKLYIDGEYKGKAKTYKPFNTSIIYLSGWANNNSYSWDGGLNDFRIYSTALSADDIKELYNTPAMIDKGGDLICYEGYEVDENIFTLENLNVNSRWELSYTERNGVQSIPIPANYFYYGSGDERNNALKGIFKENTQYKFDFWIDYDSIVYDNVNRVGGINIYYTDGSVDYSLNGTGNQTNPVGWQHKKCITAANKTVKEIGIYYWTSSPAYYRWDSIIMPMNTKTQIKKTGIGLTGQFRENTNVAQICRGDHIDSNQLIEI